MSENMLEIPIQETAPWKGRRVLVTGLSGFIGGWLARTLVDAGAHVVGLVRDGTATGSLDLLDLWGDVDLVRGSLVDYAILERALNEYEIDSVFHLAAQALVGVANRSPLSTFESNIKGSWNLLEACRVSPLIERVVVASSDKAYGVQPQLPYTEDSSLNGLYPYDASKVCTDVLARSYAVTYGTPIAVTRCANVYAGADTNWSRLIPGTIRSLLEGERPIIRTDGSPERDYIHAIDAARAYLLLGEKVNDERVRGGGFNFGSGTPISALALTEMIIDLSGRADLPADIQGKGKTHGEIDRQYLDSRKAADLLGWQPRISLEDGLRHTVAWYRTHADRLGIQLSAN